MTDSQQDLNIWNAEQIYKGDWDKDGTTTIALSTYIAKALAAKLGITRNGKKGPYTFGDKQYWELDEALQIALTVDALSPEMIAA